MKKALILCVFTGLLLIGRGQEILPGLKRLQTPSAPAFTLLGTKPAEINSPQSYDALEASIFTSFLEEGQFNIPRNYALEFTPYWFSDHPELTYEQYKNPNWIQSFIQNLSISVATAEVQAVNETSDPTGRIGFGLRSILLPGKAPSKSKEVELKIENLQKVVGYFQLRLQMIKQMKPESFAEVKSQLDSILNVDLQTGNIPHDQKALYLSVKNRYFNKVLRNISTENPDEIKITLDTIYDKLTSRLNTASFREKLDRLRFLNNYKRIGFVVEVAGAIVSDFPTQKFDDARVTKWGIWLTPSYRKEFSDFEFLGVSRYIRDELAGDFADNFDFGGRLIWSQKKFALSGEFVQRIQQATISKTDTEDGSTLKTTKTNETFRGTFNIDYRISEKFMLSYAFGKNFDPDSGSQNEVISVLSIDFNIGGPDH